VTECSIWPRTSVDFLAQNLMILRNKYFENAIQFRYSETTVKNENYIHEEITSI
jgi:hypothetical protein